MQRRNQKKKRKSRKTRGLFQDLMRYRAWEDSPGRGYSGLLKRWWEDDAAWLKKPNYGLWGLLRRLQKRRKRPHKPDFGSDQKYYDCFAKIWGWNGRKKDPDKGVEELAQLLREQAGVKWDKKAPFDPDLQFEVGVAYLSGWLTSINSNEPLLWFSRSAARNAPRGLLAMGYLHEKGLSDCPRDPVEMISYYRRAAELGNAPAKYRLACIALKLKLNDRKNVCSLLTQAAPEYRPAKVLLAKEFPEVAGSRKYRKLYKDEWEDVAEESVPTVDIQDKRKTKELILMDEEEFAIYEDEFAPIVKPNPMLGWSVNSDPDEDGEAYYPSEPPVWETEPLTAAEETTTVLDPELEQIFSEFFGNEKNSETEGSSSEPSWRVDTVILSPLEESFAQEKKDNKKRRKKKKTAPGTPVNKENQEAVDTTSQLILKKLEDLEEEIRKGHKQAHHEREKLQQTTEEIQQTMEEIHKDTRHVKKIVVENKELLISLDVSVKILQSSLQGMWSELKKTEEAFCEKLDELQTEIQNQLGGVSQKELEDAEKFMALIFLGDWREPGRLSNESCDALVAAHALMRTAKKLGLKNYAGIVITAIWALEHECRRRFFHWYIRYLDERKLPKPDVLYKGQKLEFTLGKVYKITQTPEFENFARTFLLSERGKREIPFINKLKGQSPEKATLVFTAYYIPGGVKRDFTNVVSDIANKYRNKAAHANNLTQEEANECYNMLGITDAHKDMNNIQGALKALLWLTAPLDEIQKKTP